MSLPPKMAAKVRSLAQRRKLSANRVLVGLIESGLEAEDRREQRFYEVAKRFREASDPKEIERLGEELGRMVFGD